MDNLPNWAGAAVVYGRAYRILAHMGARGAVQIAKRGRRKVCHVSEDMADAIDALNAGDEERLKAFTWTHRAIWLDNA